MDDFRNFFIGAYATSPTLLHWDEKSEIDYITEIKKKLYIRGLELPFWGNIHEHNEELFLSLLDKKWEYALTCLPGTMKSLESNPHFGLASDNETGRLEAIAFYKKANEVVHKINDYFGDKKVVSVALASSPSLTKEFVKSSSRSLIKSLKTLSNYDWQDAQLVIEHCDSGREKEAVKGFLSLEEEIEAVQYVNKTYNKHFGITINWARSVLEKRDVSTPVKHIKLLNDSNLLAGVMFSGTSDNSLDYGNWSDLHLPIAQEENIECYEKSSLLTASQIKNCLMNCDLDKLSYLGVKVLSMPIEESALDRRIGLNRDTMNVLKKTIKEIK